MLLILAILMFVAAVGFSLLGQGGGVLYTPIQVWSGIDFHVAATTSLFLIMVMSLSSSLVFRKANRIDWPLALVLESSTAVGGFCGGLWSGLFTAEFLSVLFAAVVALAAYSMVRPFNTHRPAGAGQDGFWHWRRELGGQHYRVNLAVALPICFLVGLVSGLVGVGGGVLKVPMMVLLFGIPMDIAVGSSALMVGLTAAGGFAGHVTNGHWDWRTSLILAAAVFAGAQIGSRISITLDKRRLKRAYGWFLLLIAILMLVRLWIR